MPTLLGSFTRIDLADGVCVAMADDTTVRVAPSTTAPQRADLAADVARLERGIADLTRERDDVSRLAIATTRQRDQRTSDLSVVTSERDRLRAELDRQAAHRAPCDAVDLAAAVRHEAHCMEWIASITESHAIRDALSGRAKRLREVLARHGHVSGKSVERSAEESIEGGGHGASVGTTADATKGPRS